MAIASQVTILAEDQRQQRIAYRYLINRGYRKHDIRQLPVPAGRGSGEQWVRLKYPTEVEAFRRRSARARTALVVLIDADTETVDKRSEQLRRLLADDAKGPRQDQEAIVHLIPKRHVETWVLCLAGTDVDEATDYHGHEGIDDRIPEAARVLAEWIRLDGMVADHRIPSLQAALPELRRLERPATVT